MRSMSSRGRSTRSMSNDGGLGTRRQVGDGPRPVPGGFKPRSAGDAQRTKRARYALWKKPDQVTERQQLELDWIAKTDPRLWRAYLQEGLRYVFAVKGFAGKDALDHWVRWARRSQLPAFVTLAKEIVAHRAAIDATLEHRLSNALVESTNTKTASSPASRSAPRTKAAHRTLASRPRRTPAASTRSHDPEATGERIKRAWSSSSIVGRS